MSHSMDSKRDKPRALDRKRWCPKAVPLVSDVFRFLWVASIFSFSLVALYTVFFVNVLALFGCFSSFLWSTCQLAALISFPPLQKLLSHTRGSWTC